MFQQLMPLLAKRSLTITVVALTEGQIRVNVIPHPRSEDTKVNDQIKYTHKDEVAAIPDSAIKALTTPISLTGTAEEIDARLSDVLLQFVESHTQLQATFERAGVEISDAVKAIDERNKNKTKVKATASKAEQKQDAKAKADEKPKQDEALPLWWTNPSVPPPGTAAAQSAASPPASSKEPQANSQPTTTEETV